MSSRPILLLAFGLSMFSSLVYEVAWSRSLSLVFGTTIYAFSAVLTAFMAGLALGAYFFGKVADHTSKPRLLFARLELVLAACALLLIPLFKLTYQIRLALFAQLQGSSTMVFIMFLIVFLLLIIPTGIIGATFPLMSRIYSERFDTDISDVYAVDTLCGGAGALFAGFLFLPYLGLWQTIVLAAVLNLMVGALLYARRER